MSITKILHETVNSPGLLVALRLQFQVLPRITHWSQALQPNAFACLLAA
jgi:hypothetical protein